MPTTRGMRRRQRLWAKGIGLPGDNSKVLGVARYLTAQLGVPVIGGIAVILHGYPRTTTDLDFYTPDRSATESQLRTAGAKWIERNREHVLDDVRIHTVTPRDARHLVKRTTVIDGVRVVDLKDLIAIKLRCGLKHAHRALDTADVVELIRCLELNDAFARKLPLDLRTEFKKFVAAVQLGEREKRKQAAILSRLAQVPF
jgi:hypothetical protein